MAVVASQLLMAVLAFQLPDDVAAGVTAIAIAVALNGVVIAALEVEYAVQTQVSHLILF